MEKESRRTRPMSVGLYKNGKSLRFNATASELLGDWDEVDVLESDTAVAVRGTQRGMYHVSRERGRNRLSLSNEELVEYLCRKFGCRPGDSLPAWAGEEGLEFSAGLQPPEKQREQSRKPLVLPYNRRAGDWAYVHSDWVEFSQNIREQLPRAMSAYRRGNAVLLRPDPEGELRPEARRRSGNELLVSAPLAEHLRTLGQELCGKNRSLRLRAAYTADGILLAADEELLERAKRSRAAAEPICVDETARRFLSQSRRGGFYLSALAQKALGYPKRLSIRRSGPYWLLERDDRGEIPVCYCGYSGLFSSAELAGQLECRWPGFKRLYLIPYGHSWRLRA